MDRTILEQIGLTKSEINVYLALLELGSSSTGKIVDKSKASSSKIYEILDRLIQKGLVSFIIRSGIKYFEAAPPNRLMDYMKEREKLLEKQKNDLKNLIPELELKRTLSKYKTEAKVYKGMKGIGTAFYDSLSLLKAGEEALVIGGPSRSEAINRFFVKFQKERARRNIGIRIIFNEECRGELRTLPQNNPKGHIKYMPGVTPASVNIYKDRVIIFPETKEILLIVIDSKEVADSFRVQFEMWWNQKAQSYEGQDGVEFCYQSLVDGVKADDDVILFAAKPVTERGSNYNLSFINKLSKKTKRVRLLYYGENESNRDRSVKMKDQGAEIKILPTEQTLPISTIVTGDTILNSIWTKNPTTFKIQDKTVAQSLRTNFNLLWDQNTSVVHGFKAFEEIMRRWIDDLGEGAEYYVLGAVFGISGKEPEYEKFFVKYHKYRIKKKVKVKLLFQQGTEKTVQKMHELYSTLSQAKFLPYKAKSPVATFIAKDKILMIIQEKIPIVIKVENKEIASAYMSHFESLWDQDVLVGRGVDVIHSAWDKMLDELNPGEEYYVLGASWRGQKQVVYDYFIDFHKRRVKKKVKAKFLFVSGTKSQIKENKESYLNLGEVKYLPYDIYEGIQINLYKDKVLIFVWREKEPVVFTIEDKKVYQTFKNYFDNLWKQDARIVRGLDAIQDIFEEMSEAGHCDFLGARGYFVGLKPKYIDRWEKKAIKNGFTMRNIVDIGTKGHRITTFPFAKTKYTIPKEYSKLSVLWIYGNKVAISNWVEDEPIAVIIENKHLHDMYKQQFELLWKKEKF